MKSIAKTGQAIMGMLMGFGLLHIALGVASYVLNQGAF